MSDTCIRKREPITGSTPARNEPCPCGSGKKFKKCHGDERVFYVNGQSNLIRGDRVISWDKLVEWAGLAPALAPTVEIAIGSEKRILERGDSIELNGGERVRVSYSAILSSAIPTPIPLAS